MTLDQPILDIPRVTDQYHDDLVDRWDELIDWKRREDGEKSFFLDLLRACGAKRVLDAAAGTGYHAVNLGRAGFDVTAIDICPNMIARTAANARIHGISLTAQVRDWLSLDGTLGSFDAIICLGSSFPHLLDPEDRARALARFRARLRPGGMLILDHRNFDAISAGRYANSAGLYYAAKGIRVTPTLIGSTCEFRYDFADGVQHRLHVAAIPRDAMRRELSEAGFSAVTTYGDFRPDYALNEVGFLIHVARCET